MTTPTSRPYCPDCGEPLPADSPQALCPACLMRQALASRTLLEGEANAPAAPPPSPDEIADKFPQFEILECLGRGGMGVVYKARQKSLNRLVAIKILAPERVHEARFAERFAREAELLAKLNHPHIVTIHDFGETGGLFYLVMEFVDGVNLRDLLRDGRLEPKQALAIVPPICDALQYAHDKGVVHRDIKPENLLLDRDGRIKIADFGIASLVGAEDGSAGTPPYMAPEQSGSSTAIDHRTDIYALGVVLYEMLTGERPQKDLVAPSKKVQIDVRLDEMVLRALEKSPELRYQTAGEFRTVVESLQTTAAPPAAMPPSFPETTKHPGAFRRFWWLFLVMIPVSVLLGLGLGGLWLYLAPKKYEAQTTVQVVRTPGAPVQGNFQAAWMEELKSGPSLQQVSERLNLAQSWMVPEDQAVVRLRHIVSTQQIRGTDLISIKLRHTDGKQAAEVANALVHVLQARAAELPTVQERIIVHEEARASGRPVSPNPALVLTVSAAAGLLLSPLAALLLILLLSRRSAERSPDQRARRLWIPAACIAVVVLIVAGKLWLFPTGSNRSANVADPLGQVEFEFKHPQSVNGGIPAKSIAFPVQDPGDTGWVPQTGLSLALTDGSVIYVRSRVEITPQGKVTGFIATSPNGRDWKPESVALSRGHGRVTLGLNDGLETTIRWVPVAAHSSAVRPVWFIAVAGLVALLLIVTGIILIVRLFKSRSGAGKTVGIGCLVLLLLGGVLFVVSAFTLYSFKSRAGLPSGIQQDGPSEGSLPVEANSSSVAPKSDPAGPFSTPIVLTVQGAVARPGKHALRADATLLDALAAAGGWTGTAKLDEIFVNTADGQGGKHDLHAILTGTAPNPALSHGQHIFVASRNP